MKELLIIAPMPPNLTNGRMHWRVLNRAKRSYHNLLDQLWLLKRVPDAPVPTPRVVQITSTMYLGARMDADNAAARHKWLLDWLAARGFVKNDRGFEWHSFPSQVVKRGQDYRIELTLRSVPWRQD